MIVQFEEYGKCGSLVGSRKEAKSQASRVSAKLD